MLKSVSTVQKEKSISILRILATIAVVFSHACSTITENPELAALNSSQFTFLDFSLNFCKWHVPLFFILSGVLLLNKKELTIHNCIFKYTKRIFLALLIFGIPYALLIQFFDTRMVSVGMLWKSVTMTLNNESFSHLWYLFAMIGIYVSLPVLKVIVDKASDNLLRYFLVALFILNFCVPFVNNMTGMRLAFTTPFGNYAIFYILLGYYLSCVDMKNIRNIKFWSSIGFISATIIAFLFTLFSGTAAKAMAYQSPINVLATVSLYCLIRGGEAGECHKLFWKLDRLCFGVYLIHPLFIQFVYKFLKITPMSFSAWIPMTLVFGIVFVILGFFASWIMSLIKPLKKYVL